MKKNVSYLDVDFVVEINNEFSNSGIRDLTALRSAVGEPRQGAFGTDFYPELNDKAACLLRGISRNHAFVDGNKRTALTAADVFLRLNGSQIIAPQEELADFVVGVSQGFFELDQIAKQLSQWTPEFSATQDVGIQQSLSILRTQ